MSELDLRDALTDLADQAEDLDLAGAAWRTARRRRHRRASLGVAGVVVVAGLAFGFGAQSRGPSPEPAPPVASGPHSTGLHSPDGHVTVGPSPKTGVLGGRTTFASPSGNITCAIIGGLAHCDVAERSWTLTPADLATCGESAVVGLLLPPVGKPTFDCRTNVLVPSPQRVLSYGQSLTVGYVTCTSATSGVTCTSSRTGHGFFVSRQSFEKH